MSFRKFRRKLGWRSSKDDPSALSQGPVKQDQQHFATRDDGTASGKASSNDPLDSPSLSIPETPSLPDLPPQAHPKEDTTQEIGPIREGIEGNIRELWDLAYGALKDEDEQLILDFEMKIEGDLSAGLSRTVGSRATKRDWMNTVLTRKMEQVNKNSWKLKFRSSEVLVKDMVKPILGVVSWANDFISKAVSANPSASLAWGGVSLLLPAASLAQGLEYISSLIVQSYLWEDLYERYSKSETGGPSQIAYRSALTMLYHHVLKFQITSYCYYTRSTAYRLGLDSVKWHEWEDLLGKIKEQERVFSAVLNGCRDVRYDEECSAVEQRHERVMSCWQNIGTDVSGLLSAVRDAQREKERKELLDWLCAVDTSVLYNAARDKYQTGTCSWLVEDSKDFKTWLESPKSLLWLNGKPGSGKSILSSSVIKYLQDSCNSDPGTALAYFYFNFGSLQQSVAIMLSSLVKQLCASRPDTPQAVKNFENYKTKGERPDTKTLEESLIESTRGFSHAFIVIDALDECPTLNGERGKLLASLTRIAAAMPDNLHLFCTSRAEPDISTAINKLLPSPSSTEINLMEDTTGVNSDISTYINSVLDSDDYRSWPGELKADAKRLLIEKADGMFQYIVCQFEGLRNLRSKVLISSALENLPKGLDATYDRLLLSIEPDFQAQVLSSLKWLAFSNETLELEELAEIFILHPERAVVFDRAERLFEPEEVLRYISSLVTVQKHDTQWGSSKTYVRLAHFTVKEYLVSGRISKGPAACFSFTENDAQLHISHSCLVYHLYKTDASWQPGGFPLGYYAAKNWGWHLEMTPRHEWTAELVCLAARALTVRSSSLRTIVRCGMNGIISNPDDHNEVREKYFLLRPYCYTATLGFLNLTDLLLSAVSSTYDYLTQEDLNLALHEATLVGSVGIVQLALHKGANVDAQDAEGKSALQVAASRNYSEIVDLLLRNGADMSKSGCPLTSALSSLSTTVSSTGYLEPECSNRTILAEHTRSLQLLIDYGADVNKQCAIHGTALSMAASKMGEHKTRYFVDFLLQRGAEVNLSGGFFGYPLQAACSHRFSNFAFEKPPHQVFMDPDTPYGVDDDAAVMTLLAMGAEVNAQGGEYGNALQAASYAGNYPVVRLLLDRGADINMQGGYYGTPLQAACAAKHQGIVSLLLASGADVKISGGAHDNALKAACIYGFWQVVDMLLDRGAQVHGDAVLAACANRQWKTAGVLLDRGAQVDQGSMYGNTLPAACAAPDTGHEGHSQMDLVKRLLERGVDVNADGGHFGSALHAASSFGNKKLVSLLLGKGAEVNKRGGLYGTAIQAACAKGSISVVRMLLAHGANPNIEGGEYGTALQAACARGSSKKGPELVSLLIEHGADVHVQGGTFGSAWHAAARRVGRKTRRGNDTMKVLLDHGVDVNDSKGRHGTALQAAIERSQDPERVIPRVRFLLESGANINVGAGPYGFPLQSACQAPCDDRVMTWEILNYLFANCPDIDVSMTGGKYGTALQAAAYTGKYETVQRLLGDDGFYASGSSFDDVFDDWETKVNVRGGEYGSALDAAVCAGEKSVVGLLLSYGADVEARGGKYGNALNAAVVKGYWDLVEILLEAGARPDCLDLLEPDEEWLKWVGQEDGPGAVERYRKFWEKPKLTLEGAGLGEGNAA